MHLGAFLTASAPNVRARILTLLWGMALEGPSANPAPPRDALYSVWPSTAIGFSARRSLRRQGSLLPVPSLRPPAARTSTAGRYVPREEREVLHDLRGVWVHLWPPAATLGSPRQRQRHTGRACVAGEERRLPSAPFSPYDSPREPRGRLNHRMIDRKNTKVACVSPDGCVLSARVSDTREQTWEARCDFRRFWRRTSFS